MKKFLVLAAAMSLSTAAMAQTTTKTATPDTTCFMTQVQNSTSATLSTTNGLRYLVVPGRDRVTAGFWMPLQKLQVCRGPGSGFTITNLSTTKPTTITVLRRPM